MLFLVTSSVCETTGYAIITDKLKGTTPTPTGSLKKPSPEGLYEVLCGTILQEVIEMIENDKRALMNLGGFTGQALTYSASYSYCTQFTLVHVSIQGRAALVLQQREHMAVGSRFPHLPP
jgi:hypothetical protein